jgi:hypothetical protein
MEVSYVRPSFPLGARKMREFPNKNGSFTSIFCSFLRCNPFRRRSEAPSFAMLRCGKMARQDGQKCAGGELAAVAAPLANSRQNPQAGRPALLGRMNAREIWLKSWPEIHCRFRVQPDLNE